MKRILKKIITCLPAFRLIYPLFLRFIKILFKYPKFVIAFFRFRKLSDSRRVYWKDNYPCIFEATSNTSFDTHYTYHPAWAIREILKHSPEKHYDISSLIEFSTSLSAFLPVKFYDFRPPNIHLENLEVGQADLSLLSFKSNSIKSLSCMHVVEHIGLGRYGDKIDPDGDRKAMNELIRVLAPGGRLYLVVPVGRSCIYFNAHRVYSYKEIIEDFESLKLVKFVLISDSGEEGLIESPAEEFTNQQRYGCGCFIFEKGFEV